MAQTYAGPISTLGITPSFINTLAQQAVTTGTTSAINQVWQGAGAMNAALGSQVAGPGGINISSGANFLASTITPFVNTVTAAGINQAINNSLQNAGPFAGVLSGVATGLVSQISNNLLGGAFGGAAGGFGSSFKTFPGGSASDPEANYGGKAFTLGLNGSDVVFSLQPANQGPQAFGDLLSPLGPTYDTKLSFDQLTNTDFPVQYDALNSLKRDSMFSGTEGFGVTSGLS